ncbi:MAG: type II secretion system F family protein, partial [Dehalococcoidales bacterium]
MNFSYVAYTKDKRLIKGKLQASSENAASNMLSYGGYQVLSLKEEVPFFDSEQMFSRFNRIKPMELVMFSRQLALLLDSGTDIVTSLELLQSQVTNHNMKKIIGQVVNDIRGGSSLQCLQRPSPRCGHSFKRAWNSGSCRTALRPALRGNAWSSRDRQSLSRHVYDHRRDRGLKRGIERGLHGFPAD